MKIEGHVQVLELKNKVSLETDIFASSSPATCTSPAVITPAQQVAQVAKATTVKVAYDRKTHKRCIRCREIVPLERFGKHDDNPDGRQSYCYECKNKLGKRRRTMNVKARLRHHISTRVALQLGMWKPENLTRDLDQYLGYNMSQLVFGLTERLHVDFPPEDSATPPLRLRDVLEEGWHVDHIYPLSRFQVVTSTGVDWEAFRACWAISNLRAIPAEENLAKGARLTEDGKPF